MKIEPRELLNIVADCGREIIEEHSNMSEDALQVTKWMMEKVKNKLFYLEVGDMGLSKEEIDKIIKETGDL